MDEWHGTNASFRDGDRIFRTYFVNSRGDEAMGSTWNYLDLTVLGRLGMVTMVTLVVRSGSLVFGRV